MSTQFRERQEREVVEAPQKPVGVNLGALILVEVIILCVFAVVFWAANMSSMQDSPSNSNAQDQNLHAQ